MAKRLQLTARGWGSFSSNWGCCAFPSPSGRAVVAPQQRAGAPGRGPGHPSLPAMLKERSPVLRRADQYLSLPFVAADSARQRLHFALSLWIKHNIMSSFNAFQNCKSPAPGSEIRRGTRRRLCRHQAGLGSRRNETHRNPGSSPAAPSRSPVASPRRREEDRALREPPGFLGDPPLRAAFELWRCGAQEKN